MEVQQKQTDKRHPVVRALQVFLLVLLLGLLLSAYIENSRMRQEKERMGYVASAIRAETYEIMLSEMSKIRVLEAYLMQTGGEYKEFGEIADVLLRDDFVRNVLFAPNGIVEGVFPMAGNEAVIGLNMYEDGAGNKEAQAAIEKQELFIAGPFELVQGGLGIAGRLPVFLKDAKGNSFFWGIVSVTLDFPSVLSGSSIDKVNAQGFACRIWRINPDTGLQQTMLETEIPLPANRKTVDCQQLLFNSVWNVSVAPLNPWYKDVGLWLCVAISLLVSILAAAGSYTGETLRQLKIEESNREILRLQEQLEYEQGNMLLSQIRSHFFYHTLNSLQALIVLQPEAAYKMAGDFSRYLRFNLDSITASGGTGSIKEELRAVRAYTDINQWQLGERLHVVYDIPDVNFKIPLLTIQPIVENAILHGIKPKVGGGTVSLTLEEQEDSWRVTVADDGVGFDLVSANGEQSIGLNNVRKRMSRFPGCSVRIESTLGVGTKVVLIYGKTEKNFQ